MSDTIVSLQRKINSAGDLQSVVRTMKALAASNIGQYEKSVQGLVDYYRVIKLGLGVCFRKNEFRPLRIDKKDQAAKSMISAIVFGSDQGLVGRFNDVLSEYTLKKLKTLSGKVQVWVIGEHLHAHFADTGLILRKLFPVPNSVKAIAPLIGQIQIEIEKHNNVDEITPVYVFHNRPKSGATYEPVSRRLMPLDAQWEQDISKIQWPTKNLPEIINDRNITLRALIREYLFISLFQASAQSLASEHSSRLAAMQRAEKNINELLEDLKRNFHRLRQSQIDEELFDVIAGYESLSN